MSRALEREDARPDESRAEQASATVDRLPERPAQDRPLRILLPSYRSNPTTGGQGVYMRHISKALVKLGHHVDVISGPPYPELDPRVGLIKLPSLDLYATPHPIRAFRPWMLTSKLDFFEWLSHNSGGFPEPYTFGERMAEFMKDHVHEYDVMHDNQTLCPGMLKVRDMGLPVAGTIHHPITMDRRIDLEAAWKHARSPMLYLLKRRWYNFLGMQIKVARELDPLIVVSESTKRDVAEDFGIPPDAMEVVHHGVDLEQFHPMPEVTRKKNMLLVTASADVPLKGLIFLVRAYAQLLKKYPELELHVIGRLREGQTDNELKALGIKDKVKFISGVTDDDITRLYAETTIAVSPSVYEGFGFPALEAMACGAPLVATTGGALPEVVGDAAKVVPHSDPTALAGAISELLDNPEKRAELGAAGHQRAKTQFSWERTARQVVDIYLRAIARENGRLERTGN